jgi:hypothetical protein
MKNNRESLIFFHQNINIMKFAPCTGILIFATATILSLLCLFATIVSSVSADIDSGLNRAKNNVCANDHSVKGCQQICKFVNCVGLGVKNGD